MDSNQICTNMDNIFQVAINTKFVFSQRGLLCAFSKTILEKTWGDYIKTSLNKKVAKT